MPSVKSLYYLRQTCVHQVDWSILEHTKAHYSEDTGSYTVQLQHHYVYLAPDSQFTTVHLSPMIYRQTCTGGGTGGTQFLLATACALVWVCHSVLLKISSCCTQKWHMHTMINMFLAIHSIISMLTNQSMCTYTISKYDNKLKLSSICASSEHLIVYKSALD